MRGIRHVGFGLGWILLSACGAGPYGFAREYVPLSHEEPLMERAAAVTYHDVQAAPADYRASTLGWFGIVTGVEPGPSGNYTLAVSFRVHQERHLCSDTDDSSCRVTVSERDGGPFSVQIRLRPEDREGRERVWAGSLVKVYGRPSGEIADDGGPVVLAEWYRHWPRGTYALTGDATSMRR